MEDGRMNRQAYLASMAKMSLRYQNSRMATPSTVTSFR